MSVSLAKTLSKQEIFNIVYKHLLTQNEKSVIYEYGNPRCLYRSPNGLMCAAGVLIKDEHYHPKLENHGSMHDLVEGSLRASGMDLKDSFFVSHLQRIHDDHNVSTWKECLEDLAAGHNLTIPKMENANVAN